MTREEFAQLIQSKIVVLDGATGTNLQNQGMTAGVCPEDWILKNKEVLINLQKEYILAGSDIIYAPTFSGNRIKLSEYGLEDRLQEMNRELAMLSKEAVKRAKEDGAAKTAYIAGDLTMTGKQLYPAGSLEFEDLVAIYKEQVNALLETVDLFAVETMMSLQECRAAVLAVRESCDLPVMVTLTFNETMRTFYGTDPASAVIVLGSMGADGVGVNCSSGPDKILPVIEIMKQYGSIPIIAKPNAGLPHIKGRRTVYDMEPDRFASEMKKLVAAGASIVGGCCGTTPLHIKKLADGLKGITGYKAGNTKRRVLATERKCLDIDLDGRFLIVGERINPTGKKALQEELREGKLDLVVKMAQEQEDNGADILDINMGTNGIDEKEMMKKAVYEVSSMSDLPLCIDSSYVEVIETALRIYPGRALINSISLEKEKFEKLIPLAAKYGAMFILLPLSDQGLPASMEEKKEIILKIMKRAEEFGLTKDDIIVDGLVNTIGANPKAAKEAIQTILYCKETLGAATICGLSNISFGLPQRQFVNSTFLTMAIGAGLTMAIANPSQDMLMNSAYAAELLLNKDEADLRYINRAANRPVIVESEPVKEKKTDKQNDPKDSSGEDQNLIYEGVLKGRRKQILERVEEALKEGYQPAAIIEEMLIPAINEVGNLFDRQIYFLPQLISSAETMKSAIDYLEPMLKKENDRNKQGTIVVATVEGDIHDIGKNLVVLMLKNHGFDVIDLGKDVPADQIIQEAVLRDADLIGLSALMTTTMMEMKKVVALAKKRNLRAKIIIGGAVVTKNFADEIGADGYSRDAQEAVVLAKKLLGK